MKLLNLHIKNLGTKKMLNIYFSVPILIRTHFACTCMRKVFGLRN